MDLKRTIKDIASDLKEGRFTNEAAVSQGIVLRLLNALGWDTYDTEIVIPEYSVYGRRVDFALCHPNNKPVIFIEVKQVGHAEGSEKQLFEYAFHQGVPLAVLTDGQEWHFFLPGEQGVYEERRVYKLDILERELDESYNRFIRYLDFLRIKNGSAIDSARSDYRDASKKREINETIPKAWEKLIAEKDEILLELIAEKVESLCGFKPDLDKIESFLNRVHIPPVPEKNRKISTTPVKKRKPVEQTANESFVGFRYKKQLFQFRNAREVMVAIFKTFQEEDSTFFERFASRPKHGNKRRFLAKNKYDLYPTRPDFAESTSFATEVLPGWWLGLNYSKQSIEKIIRMACEVKGIKYGKDIILYL